MSQLTAGFIFCVVTAALVIVGDVLLKLAAEGDRSIWSGDVFAGCAIYALSAIFWFYAMREITLAQAAVAYSMLTLLALSAIGALWFEEVLRAREYFGIACAITAMVLLARVT